MIAAVIASAIERATWVQTPVCRGEPVRAQQSDPNCWPMASITAGSGVGFSAQLGCGWCSDRVKLPGWSAGAGGLIIGVIGVWQPHALGLYDYPVNSSRAGESPLKGVPSCWHAGPAFSYGSECRAASGPLDVRHVGAARARGHPRQPGGDRIRPGWGGDVRRGYSSPHHVDPVDSK